MKISPSRRTFIKNGLSGVFSLAVAPMIVRSRALAADAASKKITLGFIGLGAHGYGVNLLSFLQQDDCKVLAVCDVFASRRARAREETEKRYGTSGCKEFADFRDLIAQPDIDAVVISTPDHWHVPMALMALEAGKMIFCEKPTLTIAEGRELATGVAKKNAMFAVGLEDRAVIHYHKLCEIVRNGGIGSLERIRVDLPTKPIIPKEDPVPVPADLDFDLWLGPAPQRAYSPRLTAPEVWRQIRDFSGGALTDWGAHFVDTAQVANFSEDTGPVAVSGKGIIPSDSFNDVPQTFELAYTYANGVVLEVKAASPSIRFEGSKGWVECTGWAGRMAASDPQLLRAKFDAATNRLWPRRPREQRDFLDSIKSGRPPMYTAEALQRLSTTLHVGAISMELGRPLKWDPKTELFDDAQANALRSRTRRNDWMHRGART